MKTKIKTSELESSAQSSLPALLPVQQRALEQLEECLSFCPEISLVGTAGSGCSTVVRHLAARHGGCVIGPEEFAAVEASYRNRYQNGGYLLFDRLVRKALSEHDLVVIDGFTLLTQGAGYAIRPGTFGLVLAEARAAGKRLVMVHDAPRPSAFDSIEDAWRQLKRKLREDGKASLVVMGDLGPADYASLMSAELGEARVSEIDFNVVHRYSAKLNFYQLHLACRFLANESVVTTKSFITCLETYVLRSNLHIEEVEALGFETLPGSEEIIDILETNVVLPFENRELAQKLGVKPKRGVLLYGPPGTGKTSIGRALAHRMKGKFFMIDGSINTEPPTDFFNQFQRIVTLAKENSPSVLFIDDADVLFGIHHVSGLVRYLLSLLDGLESESAGGVCVMMTAMDARKVPDALMRSGRVELWLETRPPGLETRSRILRRWTKPGLPDQEPIAYDRLGEMTAGFTPADLRRIAADARLLYAADLASGETASTATEYMVAATQDIIDVRARMAQTLGDRRIPAH